MTDYEKGYKDGMAGAALPNVIDNGDKIDGYAYSYKTDSEGVPYINIDCVRNMLNKAANVQPVNQWISVEDRLPDTPEEGLEVMYSDCCLVCDSHGWCGMAYFMTDDKKSWWEFAEAQNKVKIDWTEVTHWMPLPEPPKDGDSNG